MGKIRGALMLVGVAALSMVSTAASPSASAAEPAAPAAIDPEVLALREAAWRAYFAGDEAALGKMLPDDFIGINMFDGAFVSREAALQQTRAMGTSGERLTRLEFPETRGQRYGDVVILYGRFTAVLESGGSEPPRGDFAISGGTRPRRQRGRGLMGESKLKPEAGSRETAFPTRPPYPPSCVTVTEPDWLASAVSPDVFSTSVARPPSANGCVPRKEPEPPQKCARPVTGCAPGFCSSSTVTWLPPLLKRAIRPVVSHARMR
jgi:hypothetical protein